MNIDEIKQYAQAQIDALNFLEESGQEINLAAEDFEHLKMRQLWLVADIAKSLERIALGFDTTQNRLDSLAQRVSDIGEITEGFERRLTELEPDPFLLTNTERIEALEQDMDRIKQKKV